MEYLYLISGLCLGLILGFAAGFFVGGRHEKPLADQLASAFHAGASVALSHLDDARQVVTIRAADLLKNASLAATPAVSVGSGAAHGNVPDNAGTSAQNDAIQPRGPATPTA